MRSTWKKNLVSRFTPILMLFFAATFGVFFIIAGDNSNSPNTFTGIAAASRILNGFFGALLTSMALIITLTANLYTPRLAKIFVEHPLTLLGMGFILLANLSIILGGLIPSNNSLHVVLNTTSFLLSLIAIGGIIPYLYYVSQFIKPTFFLPILRKQVISKLDDIREKKVSYDFKASTFHSFEVLSNIAYTAAQRNDKGLLLLVISESYEVVIDLIHKFPKEKTTWRLFEPFFVPGMTQEARYYLEKEKDWPEAYFIGRLTKIINSLSKNQNDVIPFYCEKLLETLDESLEQNRGSVIEIHLMTLNALFRNGLDENDDEKIQSLSYYYRLAIELMPANSSHLNFATRSFLHYGEIASKNNRTVALETILFDLGRIILYFSYESEELAIHFIRSSILKNMDTSYFESKVGPIYYRTMTKAYWEALARKNNDLATIIFSEFIKDHRYLQKSTNQLLRYTRNLHWELNDRLLSFSHMSDHACRLATEYTLELQKAS